MDAEQMKMHCKPTYEHPIAIVLGSGLGALADRVKPVRHIPYSDIEGFPEDAIPVAGHRYEVIVGEIDGVPVVLYPGRVHMYQGYSALEVTSLIRHAHKLGCRSIMLSCATGAVTDIAPGSIGVITDQLNLTGRNPLASAEGVAAAGLDEPFVPMAGAYSGYLIDVARKVAAEQGLGLVEGIYAGLLGPSFETAAEVRALALLGADYVGMSMVCEAIMARALDMQVLGLTLVTNKAGRIDSEHADVLKAGEAARADVQRLALGVLHELGA